MSRDCAQIRIGEERYGIGSLPPGDPGDWDGIALRPGVRPREHMP